MIPADVLVGYHEHAAGRALEEVEIASVAVSPEIEQLGNSFIAKIRSITASALANRER